MFIILALSKSGSKTEEFSPRNIRKRCKDYYETITEHWQKVLQFPSLLEDEKNIKNDIEITGKVIEMLKQTKSLLEKNSKKCFPK
jgi:hypothetical protein